ncbi:MAG: FtsX-like permease family protein [Deltaproteobacteria bacterium]|nr:FtsX-like permease family protein [Deltaproteobacteria bacterium]
MSPRWALAWRNLRRNRRRSVLTGLAIGLGAAALVLLGGYASHQERGLRASTVYLDHTGHLQIHARGGLERAAQEPRKYGLDAARVAAIEAALAREPRVELVARYLRGTGLIGNGCKTVPFIGLGVDPAVEARLAAHPEVQAAAPGIGRLTRGRELAAFPQVQGPIALAGGLARLLGKTRVHDDLAKGAPAEVLPLPDCAAPDIAATLAADAYVQLAALTQRGELNAVDGEVVALYDTPLATTADTALTTDVATLQSLLDTDAVTWLSVYLTDADGVAAYASDLEGRLRAQGLDVDVDTFDDPRVSPYYSGTMRFVGSLVRFVRLLVLVAVALSVANVTTLSVIERTRELGTLRALGFTRRAVTGLLTREAAALAAVSAALGLAFAFAVAGVVDALDLRFTPPGASTPQLLALTPSLGACAFAVAELVPLSVLAAWLAVRRTTQESVISLLGAVAA